MNAARARIVSRKKDYDLYLATVADFVTAEPQPFDASRLATDPRFTLYSLDLAERKALFVETPEDVDLTDFPFLYVAQFRHATHLVSISFETLHAIAAQVRPVVDSPIFVHSVGRCGSTLVSKAMAAVPEVCSLSEPDAFSLLTRWIGSGDLDRNETRRLAESCVRITCNPLIGHASCRFWAIKFRSQCIEIADLLTDVFPKARQLYLTRNPIDWLESANRAFIDPELAGDREFRQNLENAFSEMHPLIRAFRLPGEPMPAWKTWLLVWMANTEVRERLRATRIDFLEVDYTQITTNPSETMRRIFAYCSIPVARWDAVEACFTQDSQAGSGVARSEIDAGARRLTPEARVEAEALLQSRGHLTRQSPQSSRATDSR